MIHNHNLTIDNSTHSASSTFNAKDATKTPLHLLPPKGSRRVIFNEDLNQYHDNTIRCEEDCHETWYKTQDYQEFRSNKRKTLHEWQSKYELNTNCSRFFHLLRDLYEQTKQVDYILDDVSELLNQKQFKQFKELAKLYAKSEEIYGYIGMEHRLVDSIERDIGQRKYDILKTVYEIQCEQRIDGLWENCDEEMQIEMRESCLHYSQCNVLFSQMIALAQRMAMNYLIK